TNADVCTVVMTAGSTAGKDQERLIRPRASQGDVVRSVEVDPGREVVRAGGEEHNAASRRSAGSDGGLDGRGGGAGVQSLADGRPVRDATCHARLRPVYGPHRRDDPAPWGSEVSNPQRERSIGAVEHHVLEVGRCVRGPDFGVANPPSGGAAPGA